MATTNPELLHVQVGDLIATGYGDNTMVVMITWTNRRYTPGATDAQGTPQESPSARATPVDAICLVAPVGDGQFMGTAMQPHFMTYLGWLEFSDAEIDAATDDYTARQGHTWRVDIPGYRRVDHSWWQTFRTAPALAATTSPNSKES